MNKNKFECALNYHTDFKRMMILDSISETTFYMYLADVCKHCNKILYIRWGTVDRKQCSSFAQYVNYIKNYAENANGSTTDTTYYKWLRGEGTLGENFPYARSALTDINRNVVTKLLQQGKGISVED
jgi:hypothetical protein